MKQLAYITILLFCCSFSCKKLIQVGTPQNQLTTDKVFSDSTSAIAAMVNVYTIYNSGVDPNYNKFMSVYTDDMDAAAGSGDNDEFLSSRLSATNATVSNFWAYNYNIVYACNLIIEQLNSASKLSTNLKSTLGGEAKFLRAYSYFYLVNSFGNVPLILTTNVDQTARACRTDTTVVYEQIRNDLTGAYNVLPATYIGDGRVRANKWAAEALLARVDLYQRNWQAAETEASAVINSGNYSLEVPANTFLASSNETILSFWTQNGFIADAGTFIPNGDIPQYPFSADLISSFETGDLRKTTWAQTETLQADGVSTTYFYPYKYHNTAASAGSPEYLVALRLGEQFLIRAESRAEQGNISGAIDDLNVIRTRAALPVLAASITKEQCLNAIAKEWRHEFFAEWGNHYLDLKRKGALNTVMQAYRSTWTPHAMLLPLPKKDLAADPFLTQNNGY